MTSIFVFSLIVGGGLLALSLLGDLFGGDADFDTDLDADLDVDFDFDGDVGVGVDPDLDVDADVGGDAAGADTAVDGASPTDLAGAIRIFTIRNLTYFLFGFGGVGWLLTVFRPDLGVGLITAAALLSGTVAGASSAVVFGWLKATDSGWQADETSFVGCEGRVVLPVGHGRIGTVMVLRGDREHELRAVPFDGRAAAPESWRSVVVIDMDGGTARVSPMEALAPADDGRALP